MCQHEMHLSHNALIFLFIYDERRRRDDDEPHPDEGVCATGLCTYLGHGIYIHIMHISALLTDNV